MSNKPGLIQIIRDSLWNPKYERVTPDPILNPPLPYTFNDSGENVTVDTGSKLATVFASVNLLAQDVSVVPFNVHRRGDKTKEVLSTPASRLLYNPNRNINGFHFWYMQVWLYLTYGNSYSWIRRDMAGNPEELIPIAPWLVELKKEGNEVYLYVNGVKDRVPYDEVLHFKLFSFDGICGVSPITWNAELIGKKMKENKFAARALGTKPSGFLKGDVKDEQVPNIVESWNNAISGDTLRGTPFLVGDIDYKALSIPPNELQYIETQIETRKEIYSIYRVNPTLLSNFDQGVQANAEQQAVNHTKFTLSPHYKMIEEEVDKKLLSKENYSKHNVNAFLRGDAKARKELLQFFRTGGILTGNEIRGLEDLPPSNEPGMDKVFIQGAMLPIEEAGKEVSDEL